MASDAANPAAVIEARFESAVLHTVSLQRAEQLLDVLFASLIERVPGLIYFRLPVVFRYDDGVVRLGFPKLLPRKLNMFEKRLQVVLGAPIVDRHCRFITIQHRNM